MDSKLKVRVEEELFGNCVESQVLQITYPMP